MIVHPKGPLHVPTRSKPCQPPCQRAERCCHSSCSILISRIKSITTFLALPPFLALEVLPPLLQSSSPSPPSSRAEAVVFLRPGSVPPEAAHNAHRLPLFYKPPNSRPKIIFRSGDCDPKIQSTAQPQRSQPADDVPAPVCEALRCCRASSAAERASASAISWRLLTNAALTTQVSASRLPRVAAAPFFSAQCINQQSSMRLLNHNIVLLPAHSGAAGSTGSTEAPRAGRAHTDYQR